MQIVSGIMRKFKGKIISLKKNSSHECEEQVLERGYPESLLGFLLSCIIKTRLKSMTLLLESAPRLGQKSNKHHQEPWFL